MQGSVYNNLSFNEEEKEHFLRMVEYFIRSEEKEIAELQLPSGNGKFIPDCEKRLAIFEAIKRKVMDAFCS